MTHLQQLEILENLYRFPDSMADRESSEPSKFSSVFLSSVKTSIEMLAKQGLLSLSCRSIAFGESSLQRIEMNSKSAYSRLITIS